MESESLRLFVRGWFQEQFADAESVDLKILRDDCVREVLADSGLLSLVANELLAPMVYTIGLQELQRTRRMHVDSSTELIASRPRRDVPTREVVRAIERSPVAHRDFKRWMEYEPGTGRYVSFLAMTKEQCLAAAEFREKRAAPDLLRAGLLRMAAGKLSEGQRVGEVWSDKQLEDMEGVLTVERPKYGMNGQTIFDMMKEVA